MDTNATAIIGFLKSNVPASCVASINEELKKDFVLAKKRSKDGKKKAKKKRAHCLTRKQKKALGFYGIPRDSVKYNDMIPIHERWLQYINTVVDLDKEIPDVLSKTWETFTQSLYKADFHGSLLKVVRSKCSGYVGKMGICILDTRNTFRIVAKNNLSTTIPKRECVFELYVNNHKITLFGKHLCVRPAERSTKKIKGHIHPDL